MYHTCKPLILETVQKILNNKPQKTSKMKTKKFMGAFFVLILTLITLGASSAVKAAVTVTDSNDGEYSLLLSTSTVSFNISIQTGYPANGTPELIVEANGMQSKDHLWSQPEQVAVEYDLSGNLNSRLGSTAIIAQPLTGFDIITIRLSDSAPGKFKTEFKDITVNGIPVRNMFSLNSSDYVQISGLDSTGVIQLNGSLYLNPASADYESNLVITGIKSVPEISSFMLMIFSFIGCTFIRRR